MTTRRTARQRAEAVGLSEIIGTKPAARRMHIPESTLRRWREAPEMVLLRAEKREDVAADVWAGFQKGVHRIVALMDTTEDMSKVAVATGILYDKFALMTGGPTSRSETRSVTDDLGDDEKQRLRNWIDALPADRVPEGNPT